MLKKCTTALAAAAVLGLAAVPAAEAKTSKTDKAQNKAIKKNAAGVKKNTKAISKSTKSAAAAIAAVKVIADRGDKNGAAFVAAAPTVLKALTDLGNGLTAAGAGLKTLQAAATSQEYGYAQVAGQPGGFVETPDIPDSVQQTSATGTFTAVANSAAVNVVYGVRGNEVEASGNPQAFCRTTVRNLTTPATGTTPGDPIGNSQNPPAPSPATAGFLPVATSTPFASPFGPQTTNGGTDTPSGPATLTPAVALATGDQYTLTLTCVDLTPASATDPTN